MQRESVHVEALRVSQWFHQHSSKPRVRIHHRRPRSAAAVVVFMVTLDVDDIHSLLVIDSLIHCPFYRQHRLGRG